ncbi:MAG: Na/Pi cotransporter family protein [Candidatus Cloacimonetes bacterium]|nr:Na/Pi cotransporter family protein [Candidatus Cloacimonadota bacterium]
MIIMILKLMGALGVFLYGMRVMSDGLQKAAGNKMQSILNFITQNKFMAVLTGFIITAFVQSSSATTVMVVSFVNAGLLQLAQAIGVIMGANIGTTLTTWLVSLLGFKFSISTIALPVIGIGLPLIFSKIKKKRDFGEVLIGFGLLFLGLMFLKESVPDINHHPEALSFIQNFTSLPSALSMIIFVVVGAILTVVVQSSSAAMAITVTMAAFGWINFQTAAAIVLGENIGTTVTAYVASLGTSVSARRAARAHFLFNVFGVVWMMLLFQLFTGENGLIYKIAPWNPLQTKIIDGKEILVNLPFNLSLFHTVFNLINTFICIGLIPFFAKIVTYLIKDDPSELEQEYKLQYLSTGIQDTPDFNIINARNEITKMADVTKQMFIINRELYENPDKKMGDVLDDLKKKENLTDLMQAEITGYLAECSKEPLSEKGMANVAAMMRIVNELENIGDSCYKLGLLIQRKYDKGIELHSKADEEFADFANLVFSFMDLYQQKMSEHLEKEVLEVAYKMEEKINNLRDNLKEASQQRLQQGANVTSELLYLDLLKHFEHIGDNSLNIAQALRKVY